MRAFVTGAMCAVMLTAAGIGFAAAQQYPTCTSRSDDKCMQGTGRMSGAAKSSMHKKMRKATMHKGAMKTGTKRESMMGKAAAGGSDIPHGCSPATTPCE